MRTWGEMEHSSWPMRARYGDRCQTSRYSPIEFPNVCWDWAWSDSFAGSFRWRQGEQVRRDCSGNKEASHQKLLGAILMNQERRRKSDHPGWAVLRLAVIMVPLTVVMYANASKFDMTEIRALLQFALVGGGFEAVRLLKGR